MAPDCGFYIGRPRAWLLAAIYLVLAACDCASPPTPLLLIVKTEVTPTTLTPREMSRADPESTKFSVQGATVQQGLTAGPFTSWYYDYDDADPKAMFSTAVCGSQQVCIPSICLFNPSADSHTLSPDISPGRPRLN